MKKKDEQVCMTCWANKPENDVDGWLFDDNGNIFCSKGCLHEHKLREKDEMRSLME